MIAEHVLRCEGCGDPFESKRRDARYCGATCRQRACRDRQRRVAATVCPSCGHDCLSLDEWTGWCYACTREWLRVAA